MAFNLTDAGEQLLQKTEITPQIVLDIDGVDTLYSAINIKQYWNIGDEGLNVGTAGLTIGGQISIADQENLISWSGGTSNTISQVLNVDKGENDSVSSLKIALIDKGLKATRLATPGEIVPDLLGRRAIVWIGEAAGSWRDDYVIAFRGVIDDVDLKSGIVTLNVAAPDTLKDKTTFLPGETELTAGIDDTVTSIPVLDTTDFLAPFTGPNGLIDESFKLYVRINDEIMRYESSTGTSFDTVTRGQLDTIASAHNSGDVVNSFYRMEGNAIDLALKFMLSGGADPYIDDFPVKSFVQITGALSVPNAIFLADSEIVRIKNITVGDYVTVTGATNGANNFTNREILDLVLTDVGYYIVVGGAALVTEDPTTATMDFKSQYCTWPEGVGMNPEEVDIQEHRDIKTKFLSSAEYDFYIKEEIDSGKEFLSQQIYNPVSAYSLPRKAQASIGYNIGPIPGIKIKTFNDETVKNAAKLSIKRSTNKNFYNTIVYKYQESALDEEFSRGVVFVDGESVTRIPVGNKALVIESKGLRELLSAKNTAQIASNRRLIRYGKAAESITNLTTNFKTGFDVEIGDKVILDLTALNISDIRSGTRSGESRVVEVINKRMNLRTGEVSFDLLDTNFDLDQRFALIGPSSVIKSGTSGTQFVIDPTFNTDRFGSAEWKKWERFSGSEIIVRSPDFTVSGTALINKVTSNTITVQTDLGFTPLAGYIMEASNYSDQTANVKLVYGAMSDGDNDFADDKVTYKMS